MSNDNAKLSVGTTLTAGQTAVPGTTKVVEYGGVRRSLSLVEDLDNGLMLRISVQTTETAPTSNRPNYRIEADIPVDDRVAQFLGTVIDRAEEGPVEMFPGDAVELPPLTPRDWTRNPEESLRDFYEASRRVGDFDPTLEEIDGKVVTYPEVKEFRDVVPGPRDGIRLSEVEDFRRFRATRDSSKDEEVEWVLDQDKVLSLDGVEITSHEVVGFRNFNGHGFGPITVDEVDDFRRWRDARFESADDILDGLTKEEAEGLVQPDAVDEAGEPNR